MTTQRTDMGGPLTGLRVLDLSTMIAAPLAASLLADYGAEVVKVEQPGRGDFVRGFGPQQAGEGLYWKSLSRNKRSVSLNLRTPEGQEVLRRWVRKFDVLIENFRPGTLENWGLSPDSLRRNSPRLIVLRVTAYGQFGPYRDRPGFGTLAEAMTGLAAITGYPDRPPLLPSVPMADIMAGQLGAAAVLAAVEGRHRTGEGDCIDLAIYETALKLVELNLMEFDQTGVERERSGNRIGAVAPRGSYECGDGRWLALSGSTQPIAERVLRAIGGEELVRDARFASNVERVHHADELDELISQWCQLRDRETAISELTDCGCAVGPLESIATMMENPQVIARGSVKRIHDEHLGELAMTNIYPRFEGWRCDIRTSGPAEVGHHTDETLANDLGLSIVELDALRAAGVTEEPEPARHLQSGVQDAI